MTYKPCENDTPDDIRKVFDQIDFDCNGKLLKKKKIFFWDCITRENLRELADEHREDLTDE